MRYLRPPEIRQEIESFEYKEKIQSGIIYETIHMRKDGKEFPVEISSRLIKINEKSYFQAIIRDITERKNAEEKISHLNRIYTVVSHINQAIVRIKDQQLLFEEVCRISIEYGKFRMAWIGILDEKTSKIIPVAHDGFVNGYLDNINISIRDNIEGNGPTGRAFREKRYILCNDI